MTREELICALERTASDNHRCFACGYKHNCGIHGCAINRTAATAIKEQSAQFAALRNELCQQCGKYRMAHKGACDGCRWHTTVKQDEEETHHEH